MVKRFRSVGFWLIIVLAIFGSGRCRGQSTPKPADGEYSVLSAPDSSPISYTRSVSVSGETDFKVPALSSEDTPKRPKTVKDGAVSIDLIYLGPAEGHASLGSWQLLNESGIRTKPGNSMKALGDLQYRFDYWSKKTWYRYTWSDYWTCTSGYNAQGSYTSCWVSGWNSFSVGAGTRRWTVRVPIISCRTNYYWYWVCTRYTQYWSRVDTSQVLREEKEYYSQNYPIVEYSKFPLYNKNGGVSSYYDRSGGHSHGTQWSGTLLSTTIAGLKDIDWNFSFKAPSQTLSHWNYSLTAPQESYNPVVQAYVHPHRVPHTKNFSLDGSGASQTIHLTWETDSRNAGNEDYYIEYGKYYNGTNTMRNIVEYLLSLAPTHKDLPVFMKLEGDPKMYYVDTDVSDFQMDAADETTEAIRVYGDLNEDNKVNQDDIDAFSTWVDAVDTAFAEGFDFLKNSNPNGNDREKYPDNNAKLRFIARENGGFSVVYKDMNESQFSASTKMRWDFDNLNKKNGITKEEKYKNNFILNYGKGDIDRDGYLTEADKSLMEEAIKGGERDFDWNNYMFAGDGLRAVVKETAGGPEKYYFLSAFDIDLNGDVDSADEDSLNRVLAYGDIDEDGAVTEDDLTKFDEYLGVVIGVFQNGFTDADEDGATTKGLFHWLKDKIINDNTGTKDYVIDGNVTVSAQARKSSPRGKIKFKNPDYETNGFSTFSEVTYEIGGGDWTTNSSKREEKRAEFRQYFHNYYKKGDVNCAPDGDGQIDDQDRELISTAFLVADVNGDKKFDNADMSKFKSYQKDGGGTFVDLSGKPHGVDLDTPFPVKTGGVFSAWAGKGASSIIIPEYSAYQIFEPRIWAVDTAEGNQLSVSKPFTDNPPPPPPLVKPPIEFANRPAGIDGAGNGERVDEDKTLKWTVRVSGQIEIAPGSFKDNWTASNGATGNGTTFSVKFLEAGSHRVTYFFKYDKRIVIPVHDNLGVLVDYKTEDTPVSGSFSAYFYVENHGVADFEKPILEISAYGDTCSYASSYSSDSYYRALIGTDVNVKLRKRDFPGTVEPYSAVDAVSVKEKLPDDTRDSDFHEAEDLVWYDRNIDLVDTGSEYIPTFTIKLKFARRVHDIEDLREASDGHTDGHLEGYSGINPESPVTIKAKLNLYDPDGETGGEQIGDIADLFVDELESYLSTYATSEVDKSKMTELMVKDATGKFIELQLLTLEDSKTFSLSRSTFIDAAYELMVTMNFTQREYIVDDVAGENSARITVLAAEAGTEDTSVRNGVLKWFDIPKTAVWRRKIYTVDPEPPSVTAFEQTDENGGWVNVSSLGGDYRIIGTTGDSIRYRITFTDDHCDHGPNDGRKQGATKSRRAWYPRLWVQSIDSSQQKLFETPQESFELATIKPTVANLALNPESVANDGEIDSSVTDKEIERFDGAKLAVVLPVGEKLGSRDGLSTWQVEFQQTFSPYISGKLRFILELEDSSRNFIRLPGYFDVYDNKRPNIDLRLASAKFKSIPHDYIKNINDVSLIRPPGPGSLIESVYGNMMSYRVGHSSNSAGGEVYNMLYTRDPMATGLLVPSGLAEEFRHDYDPDMLFEGDTFKTRFTAGGCGYDRSRNLDSVDNYFVTQNNSQAGDDPVISFSDKSLRDAFVLQNTGETGFAESELIVFDVSLRDNLTFIQDDSTDPRGRFVIGENLALASYTVLEDVKDQYGEVFKNTLQVTPVAKTGDPVPARLLDENGRVFSHIFRVGNAMSSTGLKKTRADVNPDISAGENSFYLDVSDLKGNTRRLELDLPIVPSVFNIRVLEQDTTYKRK